MTLANVIAVLKVNDDPDLDDAEVHIPTVNMSASGSLHGSCTAEDDADFDDF